MSAVGTFRSCFACRNGCPRQGKLAPSSLGVVELSDAPFDWPSGQALKGLEGFSHVWILWVFHNYHSLNRSPRVKPPRLGGESLGVFACRSPKRPNPIGMTACKVEGIDAATGRLFVSGIDLLDGTPILDIKPYVGKYDAFQDAESAQWLQEEPQSGEAEEALHHGDIDDRSGSSSSTSSRRSERGRATSSVARVTFEEDARRQLDAIQAESLSPEGKSTSRLSRSLDLAELIQEVLMGDPRSRISRKHDRQPYGFTLDRCYVKCEFVKQEGPPQNGGKFEVRVTEVLERKDLSEEALMAHLHQEGGEGEGAKVSALARAFYAGEDEVAAMVQACVRKGTLLQAANGRVQIK